jgi:hypothetical protein
MRFCVVTREAKQHLFAGASSPLGKKAGGSFWRRMHNEEQDGALPRDRVGEPAKTEGDSG